MVTAPAESDVRGLLRAVRTLELIGRKNVASLLAGDYATLVLGRGLLFREPRKYTPGEPARSIDWNITARLDEPYVRVHEEERQRDVFVAIDTSPSMHTGFGAKTKLELAVELAATLAVSAASGGDRIGLVAFADRSLETLRPRSGKKQLFRVLRALLDQTRPWDRPVPTSDPRAAIHAIQAHRGNAFVVFLISDFLDHDIPDDLRHARARHDVSLFHVYDPFELDPSDALRFAARAPEGGATGRVGTGVARDLAATQRFLSAHAGRHGIACASFATDAPVHHGLARFFHQKRNLRR